MPARTQAFIKGPFATILHGSDGDADAAHTLLQLRQPMPKQDPAPHAPTILVAEDSIEQRSLYVEILTSAGYRVLEASDGEEAVAIVRQQRPGLVLMDVTMPGTSGWNAVRVLKDDLATAAVPIIVITGLAASWDRDASIAAGADEYIAKPVSPPHLLEEVRKFFAR